MDSTAEKVLEAVGALWPVMTVIIGMAALHWAVSLMLGGSSRDHFRTMYFALAASLALKHLINGGEALRAWHAFLVLSDTTKYMVSVVGVAAAYFVSLLFPSGAKEEPVAELSESVGTLAAGSTAAYPVDLDWENDTKKSFEAICDMLIDEVLKDLKDNYEGIPEEVQWVKKMLEYNVKGGKMNRGIGVIDVQKAFAAEKGIVLTNLEHCKASVLGWCIEWLQAFFLVADDVMDDSHTRRGQPCWFRQPHVKQVAINDAFILESLVYKVLKKHFSHETFYLRLVELFHDVVYRTELGQLLDLTSQPLDRPTDISRFTATRHAMIVKYKTAFYTFYLPCAIGMISAGVTKPSSFDLARQICCTMGEYFQIQDDYLDCYGKPEVIGKVGTDIQDNKCSWLVVQALNRCTQAQKDKLVENYGKDEPDKIARVKELYDELRLPDAYTEYEDRSYENIQRLIAQVTDVPKDVYNFFIKRIYKRDK